MVFERFFKKNTPPRSLEQAAAQQTQPEKKDPREEREKGSIQAEMGFTFFNRAQQMKVGGESLTEIADKVGTHIAELEMLPVDSVVSNFSIKIPGHPEVNTFPVLMQHATKVERGSN